MRLLRSALVVVALGVFSTSVSAAPIEIDFESLGDLDPLSQLSVGGISFSGGIALLSGAQGGSLNDFDFPPTSGNVVAFDGDPTGIRVDFADGASSVSGHFTYNSQVTLTAFSGATLLGSVTSLFGDNTTSSGNPMGELLAFGFAGGITHITLVGGPFGGSFTLDDLFVNTLDAQPDPVPEPGTLSLLLLGASVLAGRKRLRGFRRSRRAGR